MKKGKKGFTLVELMIVVVILGILAAIAIPAFIKYIRNSKTSEAKENLAYLYRESTTYYAGERVAQGMGGADIPPQFPGDAGPTPPVPGPGMKTTAAAGAWEGQTWQALKFGLADPHYYCYTYVTSGSGAGALFTARAEGDLDGDGTTSLFERAGRSNANMEVEGSRGLFEQDPLE